MKVSSWKFIVSSILIALPVLVEAVLMQVFSDNVKSLGGLTNSQLLITNGLIVLGMLLVHWCCMLFIVKDKYNNNQNETIFNIVFWIVPVTSLLTTGICIKVIFGLPFNLNFYMSVLLALLFVVFGNYMPKCRRNYTIGIKVSWTLGNDENWNATHRFAGKVWVIGGLVWLIIAFLPGNYFLIPVLVIVPLLVLMPVIYSYMYYRKQVKEGTYNEDAGSHTKMKSKYAVIICVVIFVLVILLFDNGSVGVEFSNSDFTIEAAFWKNMTIRYDEIESVEYLEQYEKGSREFGYASFTIGAGAFNSEEFGDYTLYAYLGTKQGVCINVNGEIVVVSAEDEEATKAIYEELKSRMR